MKIIIKESQLKKLLNEIGGYDDSELMGQHGSEIQSTLLSLFNQTTSIVANLLDGIKSGKLEKENYLAFAHNLSKKIDSDLNIIDSYVGEIFIDDDFKNSIINYRNALQNFQNTLRLIYDGGMGLGIEMTKNEIYRILMGEVDKLSSVMEPLAQLFYQVHGRFRKRLGLN
jgi:N-acetylglucosamine kinase-like BadF-type ATPase